MRSLLTSLVALFSFALVSSSARASISSGTWVPAPSQTAEYCLGTDCSTQPFDASIEIGAPASGGNVLLQTSIRFPAVSPDFAYIVGSVFANPSELPFDFTQAYSSPIESLPRFEHRFDFRFESEVALTLSGFVTIEYEDFPRMEVRFDRALFVPIPEPSVAAMVGVGLLILSATCDERGPSARTGDPGCRPPTA